MYWRIIRIASDIFHCIHYFVCDDNVHDPTIVYLDPDGGNRRLYECKRAAGMFGCGGQDPTGRYRLGVGSWNETGYQ